MHEKELFELVFRKVGVEPTSAKRLGGGYYADVYLLDLPNADRFVVKVYKTQGMMEEEAAQISVLRPYALFPMPEILWMHNRDAQIPNDALAMQYLPGENAGSILYFSRKKRERLANQVIDNLLAWHNTTNPSGFGKINGEPFFSTWEAYYRTRAEHIFSMAEQLHKQRQLSETVLKTMHTAVEQFDKIFCIPVETASLIHGDYNMWNIMADKKACRVTAVIDPCNCMWADSEMDLYQLNNANGKQFHLLEIYSVKKPLSPNFEQKSAFYELFTEVEHYFNSGYPVVTKRVHQQAEALQKYLSV